MHSRTCLILGSVFAIAVAAACGGGASGNEDDVANLSERAASACHSPDGTEPRLDVNGTPMVLVCHDVYADPTMKPEELDRVKGWFVKAIADIATTYGDGAGAPPRLVSCISKECIAKFSGPTGRSHTEMTPLPTIYVNGLGSLTEGTIVHEMSHVVVARKRSAAPSPAELPAWFDEGVATFLGDNASAPPGTPPAIDDLRRLRTGSHWTNFTNQRGTIHAAYRQVRDEVAAWADRHGRQAIVSVIDGVMAGGSFDDLYGPLLLPGAPDPDVMDARFSFDESAGDASGRGHAAALVSGATWVEGERGGAVRVGGGSHVLADGFVDFGLPDRPFSIALWVKPEANAKVLAHASADPSGGDGWCNPLLGHDASGRLVAEINWGAKANTFLVATGPILPTNAWSHLVMTWSANDGVRLYVNGVLGGSAAPPTEQERHRDVPALPMHLLFGSDNGGSCWDGAIEKGSWSGAIDEIRVYNHALTAADVTAEMGG